MIDRSHGTAADQPRDAPAAPAGMPCEEMFERLVEEDPRELVRMIESGDLRPSDLTHAAEIAGRIPDSDLVRPALVRLLNHASPLVREGAIYGLVPHWSAEVATQLQLMSGDDPSPGVREAASEVLENAEQ